VTDRAKALRRAGAAPASRSVALPSWMTDSAMRVRRFARRWFSPVTQQRVPRGAGIIAAMTLLSGSLVYGTVRGGPVEAALAALSAARDAVANAFGFRITSIALAGGHQLTREEILTIAGVTGRTSLLFLDATSARARLKANPWVVEATVLKLYPGRLHISIVEREAFALWQKDGKVAVISADGTVLEPYVTRRFARLPMVVGAGSETKAKDFLATVDQVPSIRDQLQSAILVANRRWNLKLKNGIDIKLPETGVEAALETLVRLDQTKKLLTRDIDLVDLRLSDRVTVRLSDGAYATRLEQLKPAKAKGRGGSA
jgi:cell division protein FtsQ